MNSRQKNRLIYNMIAMSGHKTTDAILLWLAKSPNFRGKKKAKELAIKRYQYHFVQTRQGRLF